MRQEIADCFPGWPGCMIIPVLAVVMMAALSVVPCTAGAVKFTDIATGHGLSVALSEDGRVWTWGNALHGALGINSPKDTASPRPVEIDHVIDVAAGSAHVLALKDDGTVWAWGYNNYGQLGIGTTGDRYLPARVEALDHVKSVAAGLLHSVALKDDGTVWAWGYNNYGQLGTGAFNRFEPTPVQVTGLSNIVRVYAGYNHNVAIDGNGNAWAWGSNECGELGDGTNVSRCTPIRLAWLAGVKDVAPGSSYTIALIGDGTVRAWGENLGGWLGDGTTTLQMSPVTVKGVDHAKAVATGEGISFASRDDGSVMAWGMNNAGLIGNGARDQRVYQPGKVGDMKGIVRFAVGPLHVLGLKADGSLWGWGDNQFGEMGIGRFTDKTYTPMKIPLDEPADPPQATGQPAATPGYATDGTPTQVSNDSLYLQYGIIALMCLVIGACALIWYSRR